MAKRARFVHRRRADRIKRAEERKVWIFVLDFAVSVAETVMAQQKKIKTVTLGLVRGGLSHVLIFFPET